MPAVVSFSFPPLVIPSRSVKTPPPLFTGNVLVDQVMGGVPRANLTEICGTESAGSTGLLLSLLQQTTANGEFCALIDWQDAFDPSSASAMGLELNRLLWVRCNRNLEHALKATDLLIKAAGFGVVALDLVGVSPRLLQRIPIASWFRLRHGAEQSGTALVVTSQDLHTGSCSRLQIEVHQEQSMWSATLLQGIKAQLRLGKRNHLRAASFRVER